VARLIVGKGIWRKHWVTIEGVVVPNVFLGVWKARYDANGGNEKENENRSGCTKIEQMIHYLLPPEGEVLSPSERKGNYS